MDSKRGFRLPCVSPPSPITCGKEARSRTGHRRGLADGDERDGEIELGGRGGEEQVSAAARRRDAARGGGLGGSHDGETSTSPDSLEPSPTKPCPFRPGLRWRRRRSLPSSPANPSPRLERSEVRLEVRPGLACASFSPAWNARPPAILSAIRPAREKRVL